MTETHRTWCEVCDRELTVTYRPAHDEAWICAACWDDGRVRAPEPRAVMN